jgi:orotidine-5'-phosphate decarboxylase
MAPTTIASQSYASRIANFSKNEAAKALLETMERKQTNLCVSVDVTTKKDLLDVIKAVASVVALVKVRRQKQQVFFR